MALNLFKKENIKNISKIWKMRYSLPDFSGGLGKVDLALQSPHLNFMDETEDAHNNGDDIGDVTGTDGRLWW